MWVGLALVFGMFMLIGKKGVRLVPTKLQSVAEIALLFLRGLVDEFIGKEERKFFPFVASLFFFILSCNLIGLFPGSYTLTSQLVVTGTFAVFKKCITKGPLDTLLEGCPWDAIDMVPIDEYEKKYGELPY